MVSFINNHGSEVEVDVEYVSHISVGNNSSGAYIYLKNGAKIEVDGSVTVVSKKLFDAMRSGPVDEPAIVPTPVVEPTEVIEPTVSDDVVDTPATETPAVETAPVIGGEPDADEAADKEEVASEEPSTVTSEVEDKASTATDEANAPAEAADKPKAKKATKKTAGDE